METNKTMESMKSFERAVQSYIYLLWEITYESNAQNVLELGSRQMQSGRTFLSALEQKKSGLLTAVDLQDRTHRIGDELKPYLRMVVGNTHHSDTFAQVADRLYDILFIDAGHSYEDVKQDYSEYSTLVKKGGLIILHDICNRSCGVPLFWSELVVPNKISLNYGKAAKDIVPGLGIIQVT